LIPEKDVVSLSNTVAVDFGRALFGPAGGTVFALVVAFSCFGALNGRLFRLFTIALLTLQPIGATLTGSHLIYAAGRERFLPSLFGLLHKTRKTPLNAALLQAGITICFILIGGGFRKLINFAVVASWAFHFLTVSQ
jgi:amino acid transporter